MDPVLLGQFALAEEAALALGVACSGIQTAQVLCDRLNVSDFLRGASFTGATRGEEQTVASYVQRIVNHELEHGRQLDEIVQALERLDKR